MESSLIPLITRAVEIVECRKISVVLADGAGGCYNAAALGIDEKYVGISMDDENRASLHAMRAASLYGRPVCVKKEEGDFTPNPETKYESDIFWAFPLFSDGRVIGVMNAADLSSEPGEYFVDAMSMFAEYAAQIVRRTNSARSRAQDMLRTIELKDGYTKRHCQKVAKYSDFIARNIHMRSRDRLSLMTYGLVHDLGKIGVRDAVLQKPGRLDDAEFNEMKAHSSMGAYVLNDKSDDAMILKDHHERWDGQGYNGGKKGWEIDHRARVLSVADAFDAITSDRPYRKAMEFDAAVDEIESGYGTQFDPSVVDIFARIARDNPEALIDVMVI